MRRWLTRKIHSSWLLMFVSIGSLGGIYLGYFTKTAYFHDVQWLIIALAILCLCLIKRIVALVLLAIIAGLLLGMWRSGNELAMNVSYQQYIGKNITLTGKVADDISHKNGVIGLPLNHVQINGQTLPSKAWVGLSGTQNLKRGDVVSAYGKLQSGFGEYTASMSHAKLLSTELESKSDWSRRIRDSFTNGLKKAVSDPEASLGAGYLDGQHNELPDMLVENLKLTGLIHIVIAGGYNATILVRYVRRRFVKISRYLAIASASAVLIGILLMTGFSAPMSRTVVITFLSLLTWYYGRKIHPLVLLFVSASITALIDPTFVKSAVGWYLTFIAYGGLIILGPLLTRYFWHNPKPNNIRQIFIDTLSVQIVTMPLLAFAFQQYSIYGLIANLLVLPLMPITMLLSVVAGVFGIFSPEFLAHFIGWPAKILLSYTVKITNWLAGAPGAHYSADFSLILMISSYGVISLLIFWLWRKTKYDFREENIIE